MVSYLVRAMKMASLSQNFSDGWKTPPERLLKVGQVLMNNSLNNDID